MTFKFNTVLKVVKLHVCAKFHQAECSYRVHKLFCLILQW